MSGIIISDVKALSRDIDVSINISKVQVESTTDFSVLCFCTPDAIFDHDGSRVRYYDSLDAVRADFAASSEAVRAATDFFSQAPRAKTLAIGRIFEQPVAGFCQGGPIGGTLEQWQLIADGCFKLTINGVTKEFHGVSFATITNLSGIAGVLQTAIRAAGSSGDGFYNALVSYNPGTKSIRITSGTTGVTSTVAKLQSADTGTDISGVDYLNMAEIAGSEIQPAYCIPGYTPEGIASELNYIKEAGYANKRFLYGWALDRKYRDSNDCLEAAAWIESQTSGILGLVTNSPMAYETSSITDVGYMCEKNGYRRTFVTYHNNPFYYPEVAIIAYALHVNYRGIDTTITTKFKNLYGIPTVPMTTSQLAVLNAKRINTFTLVGNDSRTFREGVESNDVWFMDDLINLDNFREDLQTEVYNVFLRNKKIPYNNNGVNMLRNAMIKICDQYVKNGCLSERELTAIEKAETGRDTEPAYIITFTDVADVSAADRANRIGPPAQIKLNLAGAIHSLSINVEAYA